MRHHTREMRARAARRSPAAGRRPAPRRRGPRRCRSRSARAAAVRCAAIALGRVQIVGEHDDRGAGAVQLGDLVELLRRDADRVENVGDAVPGEILRLGQRRDGDAAGLAGESPGAPRRSTSRSSCAAAAARHAAPAARAMASMLRCRMPRSSTRHGVGRSASFIAASPSPRGRGGDRAASQPHPQATRRSAASPSGRCRSAPAPWSAPA